MRRSGMRIDRESGLVDGKEAEGVAVLVVSFVLVSAVLVWRDSEVAWMERG